MIIDTHTHFHNYELHGEGLRFTFEEFIHELDHHGIDKTVVSNVFYLETDFIFGNELLFEFMEKYPDRVIGFVCLHPLFFGESARILEKGLSKGIRGVKLHRDLAHCRYDDPAHIALLDLVKKHKIPVTLHSASGQEEIERIVRMFPDITFLLGHAGGFQYRSFMTALKDCHNAIADLCGTVFLDSYVEELVGIVGDGRVTYSSDFTFIDPAVMLNMVKTADIPEKSKEKILGANAERILGL
jgi:predicted TIM-barrel fold metal-dependent hydrolase